MDEDEDYCEFGDEETVYNKYKNESNYDTIKNENIDKKFAVVNPAKMCQPIGAIHAIMGLKNAMPLIHGSQGCATYMRFQLIRHFREPIEVASTSLNEKTVIYGGEHNLLKALKNISEKQDPDIICVTSSCLTETIGDDIEGVINKFKDANIGVKLPGMVFIPTPSFKGSHIDGYDKAILEIVRNIGKVNVSNNKINLIMGNLSPSDVGEVKQIMNDLNVSNIILTDTSLNLDAPLEEDTLELHKYGTSLEEIEDTPDSKATISLSKHADSAGKYLENKYGVECISDNLPIGIRNTDKFIKNICNIMDISIPMKINRDRGRLCDILVDSHSYNYRKKVAIFGDPDMVIGIAHLVSEMGMIPKVLCIGIESEKFMDDTKNLLKDINSDLNYDPIILEESDLFDLEKVLENIKVDVLIGNAYGASISDKLNIPLFRVGFPIFDRVGSQRISVLGYNGGIKFIDGLTNLIIDNYYDSEGYKLIENEKIIFNRKEENIKENIKKYKKNII